MQRSRRPLALGSLLVPSPTGIHFRPTSQYYGLYHRRARAPLRLSALRGESFLDRSNGRIAIQNSIRYRGKPGHWLRHCAGAGR
jgi:hypothetical protein